MKQCASTVTALPFVLRDRLWLVFILMLSLLTPPEARAEYAPDENNNPIWAGADAEPAEGPDWSDDEGDSVPNWLENYFETATWLADTDSDGLSDWDEIFGTGTNPVLWDTNGNGLSDADDLIQPPDAGNVPPQPTADDFDGDGLPDLWELAYALNAYDPSDAAADPDDDSLTNLEEYQHATDPNTWNDATALVSSGSPPGTTADEDQDGLPDLWELANGLNPNDASDIADDPDGDFILNIEEYHHGTDPQMAEDFWTVMGYPIDTSTLNRQNDGTERDSDWDGDGATNASEIADGTDPREVLSQNGLPPDPELPFIEDQPPTTNEQDQPPANVQTGSQANDSDTGSWSVLSESVVIDSEDYVRDETRWGAWTEMVAFSTPGIGGNYIGVRVMKRVGWTGSLYKVTSHKVIRTINSKTGEVKESTLDPTVNEEFRGMAPVSEEDIDFIWGPNENQPGTSAD